MEDSYLLAVLKKGLTFFRKLSQCEAMFEYAVKSPCSKRHPFVIPANPANSVFRLLTRSAGTLPSPRPCRGPTLTGERTPGPLRKRLDRPGGIGLLPRDPFCA